MNKIAVFLPNWVGDVVMATPTLRALRRHFHDQTQIVGILRPHLRDLLAGTQWLDQLWPFDPKSGDPALGRRALLRQMRGHRFDLAVLLTNSFHTAALAWLGGARRRLGYARGGRSFLLTDKLHPQREGREYRPVPMVDYYLALASAAGCPSESPQLELATTDAEERLADSVWQSLGLSDSRPVIAINSGAAYGGAKRWPPEHAAELARLIVDRLDHDVLIVCGPQERDTAREIAQRAERTGVVSLADQPIGLGLTKACLKRCRLLVATDSGPRHVAAAFGRAVVTLLGPTSPVWIANPTVRGPMLRVELDCLECARRECPQNHGRCMSELRPEMVLAAVEKTLAEA